MSLPALRVMATGETALLSTGVIITPDQTCIMVLVCVCSVVDVWHLLRDIEMRDSGYAILSHSCRKHWGIYSALPQAHKSFACN